MEDDAPAADDDDEVAADDADDAPTDDAPTDDAPTDDGDDLDALLGLAGADDDTPADDETAAAPEADADDADDASDGDDATTPEDGDDEAAEEPVVRRRPESMADVRDRRDLIRLPGDWYVVHTYSGYEQRVKDNLTNRIEALAAEDRIYELVIPTEEVTEFKKGKKQTSEKKFLPGYVLIRMDLDDETWNIVRHTPAVTGFVGATASKPVPLSLREVAATLKIPDRLEEESEGDETEEETAKSQVAEIDLEVGETIRVTSGPFADFTGTIAEINLDQAKLRVMVSVFGRETPLEMPFDQVAKIT
ncbi:transcription termination/antitermination protein NusG [Nitriliruptoria bacterium AS10]|nr:transcription termination/antitermination protein NusG [Salsipaludibacter albus]